MASKGAGGCYRRHDGGWRRRAGRAAGRCPSALCRAAPCRSRSVARFATSEPEPHRPSWEVGEEEGSRVPVGAGPSLCPSALGGVELVQASNAADAATRGAAARRHTVPMVALRQRGMPESRRRRALPSHLRRCLLVLKGAVLLACQSSADEGAGGSGQTVVTIEPIVGSVPWVSGAALGERRQRQALAVPAPTATPTTVAPTTTMPAPTTTQLPALTYGSDVGRPWGSTCRPADVRQPEPHVSRRGPVPAQPSVLWRYPNSGMCGALERGRRTRTWCGTGCGQAAGGLRAGRPTWVVFGAYDYNFHFLDAATAADPAAVPDRRHRQGHGDGRPRRLPAGVRRIAGQQAACWHRSSGGGRAVGARLDGPGAAAAAVEQRLGRRTSDHRRLPGDGRREQSIPRRAPEPVVRCRWAGAGGARTGLHGAGVGRRVAGQPPR